MELYIDHGRDFLEYVAKNEKRLKKNLRKNITYDEDLFDDVYQNTIVKVYNAIEKGTVIEDFEKYFFMASRFEYINCDNKHRKRKNSSDSEFIAKMQNGKDMNVNTFEAMRYRDRITYEGGETEEKEERSEKIQELFKLIAERLNEVFRPDQTDIFLIYFKLKSEKAGISYKKLSHITGKTVKEITQIVQRIKKFIRNDELIMEKKRQLNAID